jgi:eukaryotic-like serine/threonine-protein kinase
MKCVMPELRSDPLSKRYRTLFVLGRGGMGSVEAALTVEDERVIALKRLLPEAARDKRRADMFLREARVAAMLDHPNVVRAYDYGEIDGELFLAMEYVEGQPLSRLLRALAEAGTPLSLDAALYVVAEMCRGLHAAHELSDPETGKSLHLVHRDVSPQNVMIGYDGRVRLLDFGVAKIETESSTKTGEVKGKTAYMSPEQAMGEPLDRRSDLFGVGAVLFECIALRRMWGDGTDMEVLRKLALDEPPVIDAPKPVAEIQAQLIARDPKERPASAADVAARLDALIRDGESAASELRDCLTRHFESDVTAQRRKLTTALHDVVPERAEAVRASTVDLIPAKTRGSLPQSKTNRWRVPIVIASAALTAAAIWQFGRTRPDPKPAPVELAEPAEPASPLPPKGAPASSAVATTATTEEPPAAIPSAGPAERVIAAPRVDEARRGGHASKSPEAARESPQPSAAKSASPPRNAASTPKPPDVDEHPF